MISRPKIKNFLSALPVSVPPGGLALYPPVSPCGQARRALIGIGMWWCRLSQYLSGRYAQRRRGIFGGMAARYR